LPTGSLFVRLFVILALGVALLIVLRAIRRAVHEPQRRWVIVGAGIAALGLWGGASYPMPVVVFWTGWGLGHQHPLPPGPFPEGWTIYALLSADTALGAGLVAGLARVSASPLRPQRKSWEKFS
jgi:hypothetical protein